ncbi:MAG TPA: serine/threonine-protein kinase, partial [Aestuariivirgaceae bacterium]|nr:serine/threonine-protein kinase [Aestuariivirgaceae bacterium]
MTGRGQFPRQKQNVPRGTQLNNMFEIDELVTAGGMGEVYRGHNIQTKDPVAIKIVLPEFAEDEMILELFRKEARILNHLHHEAIVRYYVFSIDAALKLPFLAMEFVDGPSLAERIKQGPLDTASVVTLQRHLADGLEKAHQAGVIHRDIAPDNIILPDGRVDRAKIIDFGIARSAAVGGGTLLGGQFAGKYGFVSPEQLGLFGGDVTNRSDIYSLGLVLAACVLGRPLNMSGSQVEVIEKRRAVPDLTGIEPPLRDLIEAMLQPDPQDRPQSMAEVADWSTY